MTSPEAPSDDDLLEEFSCPRCSGRANARFYGPCTACVAELRATQGGAQREVVAPEYEPKMNVTPNAVASKE